jgi:acyl-CoA dehydrogenase
MGSWLISFARRRNLVPQMSATELEALAAGTVWVDGEIFSGKPDLARLLREPWPHLTAEEQAFLDGPVEEVCRMVDDWEMERTRQLPPEALSFLRARGFFGLTVPKEYGGRAFSALACSEVFGKLTTRSGGLAAYVVLPNSVGPAELLAAYGTSEQKDHYLPRLASGEEIPCFALTEPEAGSDAASLQAHGLVFRGPDGRPFLRLHWNKRYITLAPVATLIGLAVRLRDPENLLGKGEDVGITCVLVPASAPGVTIGRRHDPMGMPFPNGPTEGRDVLVPADQIIGGPAGAGRGWQMLMEALSAGRAIALPAQSAAGAKMVARFVGAYAAVRQQFGLPIARFEGIEEPLARIAGLTYLLDAVRVFTCGAIDNGKRPAVISAVVKYHETELVRKIVTDAMDVMGGAGICLGPRNRIARGYMGAPIGITVEGANILTRTLIIYGQGAIRCHPYAQREIQALQAGDGRALLSAVAKHGLFTLRNLARAAVLSLTRGRIASAPASGPTARYYRRLAWAAASFAWLSDLAMIILGARLKQKGKLTGRFADALSWMYLALATLRRYEAEDRRDEDLPLVQWATEHSLAQVQAAFDGILENFDAPVVGSLLRGPVALWSRLNRVGSPPSDRLGAQVARLLTRPGPVRERLTAGIFLPTDASEPLARIELAFRLAAEAAPVLDRLRQAARRGALPKGSPESQLLEPALAAGLIDAREAGLVREAAAARLEAIQVDSFSEAEYLGRRSPGRAQEREPVGAA